MNKNINNRILRSTGYITVALVLMLTVAMSTFGPGKAGAAQLTSRSIQLSDSGVSGSSITTGVGSGSAVTYKVSFTATSNANSLIIDFCALSPIIGDSCTRPVDILTPAPATIAATAGNVSTAKNWTAVSTTSGQVKIANTAGAGDNITAGAVSFDLTGFTNPSAINCYTPTTGTGTLSSAGTTVTGTGTSFTTQLAVGDSIIVAGVSRQVTAIASNTSLTISSAFSPALTNSAFTFVRPVATGPKGCTYYARIYTYGNNTYGTYASPTSLGNDLDYGGIALSTTQIISITARVQEQLTFCISGAGPSTWTTTSDCSDTQAAVVPALTLGHGAITKTLDATAVDSATAFSQLSTNATSGVVVRMRNSNLGLPTPCAGLSANATNCGIAAVASSPVAITVGSQGGISAFGLFVWPNQLGTNGTFSGATCAPNSKYYDPAHATFTTTNPETAAVSTTSGVSDAWFGNDSTNVTTTFGDAVTSCNGPVYRVNGYYTFAATAALTTPAGIYTANIDLIATGTF